MAEQRTLRWKDHEGPTHSGDWYAQILPQAHSRVGLGEMEAPNRHLAAQKRNNLISAPTASAKLTRRSDPVLQTAPRTAKEPPGSET